MLKIGQVIKGSIRFIDEEANGILQTNKDKVFVRNVMRNEEVEVRIKKRIQKGYSGEIVRILKPSNQRIKPKCSIYDRCGSCQLMHMKHEFEADYKQKQMETLCQKEHLSCKVKPLLDMQDPYHYRNKMIIGFSYDSHKQVQAGFYEEFSHQIIPYKTCLLHPKPCDEIIRQL